MKLLGDMRVENALDMENKTALALISTWNQK